MVVACEQERQINDPHVLAEIRDGAGGRNGHVNGSELQSLQQFTFTLSQLATAEHLDDDFTVGGIFHQSGELFGAHGVGVVIGCDGRQLEDVLGLSRSHGNQAECRKQHKCD